MPEYHYISNILYRGTLEELFFRVSKENMQRVRNEAQFRIALAEAADLPIVGRFFSKLKIPVYAGHPTKATAPCGRVLEVYQDLESQGWVLKVRFKLYRHFPELRFVSPTFKTKAIDRNYWEPVRLEYIGLTSSPRMIQEEYTRIKNER